VAQGKACGDTSRSLGAPASPYGNGSPPRAGRVHRLLVLHVQNRMVGAVYRDRESNLPLILSINACGTARRSAR
jgi:hypothetical protein